MTMPMTLSLLVTIAIAATVLDSTLLRGNDPSCEDQVYHECCRHEMHSCAEECLSASDMDFCWEPCTQSAAVQCGRQTSSGCCRPFLECFSACLNDGDLLYDCWIRCRHVPC
uniref:Ctr_18_N conopeptide n=1 Tax=Conus tribblei TaxID=101761 RepID=A0A0C9RYM4_CONTD